MHTWHKHLPPSFLSPVTPYPVVRSWLNIHLLEGNLPQQPQFLRDSLSFLHPTPLALPLAWPSESEAGAGCHWRRQSTRTAFSVMWLFDQDSGKQRLVGELPCFTSPLPGCRGAELFIGNITWARQQKQNPGSAFSGGLTLQHGRQAATTQDTQQSHV